MKPVYLLPPCLMTILILIPMASAAGVTRSLSSGTVPPGGSLTVTLSVDVSGAGDNYAIDETYPPGWSVKDAGSGSTEHTLHWKHLVLENAQNTQLTYTLIASEEPGTYTFSGEYMFGGMEGTAAISGQDTVSVAPAMDTTWLLLAAVLVVVAAALIFLKKPRG